MLDRELVDERDERSDEDVPVERDSDDVWLQDENLYDEIDDDVP